MLVLVAYTYLFSDISSGITTNSEKNRFVKMMGRKERKRTNLLIRFEMNWMKLNGWLD
jgi:hypothetical protein